VGKKGEGREQIPTKSTIAKLLSAQKHKSLKGREGSEKRMERDRPRVVNLFLWVPLPTGTETRACSASTGGRGWEAKGAKGDQA